MNSIQKVNRFLVALAIAALTGCAVVGGGWTGQRGVPYVFSPAEAGMYPGVIILHAHDGLFNEDVEFARNLSRKGFHVAVVDYYAPGGIDNVGAAYETLKAKNRDKNMKIGLVGFSKGAMYSIERSNWESRFGQRVYSAIVSLYIGPYIGSNSEKLPPVLFLQGEKDGYVTESAIVNFCNTQKKNDRVCDMKIYPNVKHAFDRKISGYNGYDSSAATDSEVRAAEFLKQHLSN